MSDGNSLGAHAPLGSDGKSVSVIMTLCDREPEVMLACLRSVRRSFGSNIEVVIANDGSESNVDYARNYLQAAFAEPRWVDLEPYEAFRIAGNFNNPARAFNAALLEATHDQLVVLSSDVLVTPRAAQHALRHDWSEVMFSPKIVDLESGMEYCGPQRLTPFPWMLCVSRPHALEVGGWDEAYLKGMCYEDNDFVGRVAVKTGGVICDWTCIAYHISHDQPAYDVSKPEVVEANDRSRAYTREKWGGIPWDYELTPFDVIRKPWPTGDFIHKIVTRKEGLLERLVDATSGLVKEATLAARP